MRANGEDTLALPLTGAKRPVRNSEPGEVSAGCLGPCLAPFMLWLATLENTMQPALLLCA